MGGVNPAHQFSFSLVSTIAKCLIFGIMVFSSFLNSNSFAQIAPDLGSAARFGLLAGDSIRATDTVKVFGNAGYEVVEVKALASGMYFFKCMVNGNVAQTNTFIVKH